MSNYALVLRQMGVSAAHPADGWFKRNDNPKRIHLSNPYFRTACLSIGDIIAIGWRNNWHDEPSAGTFTLYRIIEYKPWILRLYDSHGDYILEQVTGEFCIRR